MRSCNSSINSDHERAVCRKIVEDSNGKRITKRFCYYTNKSDPVELCNVTSTEKNVQRIFCEDCMTNLCNAGTQLASMLGAFLFPTLALAKNLAL
ncbi:uncharacterized protein LOC115630803 isoform X2 [Scaptodrosophila lebanonensis]|nr:uncharacterized protein LOC115630803 isoform X2 [Scaptodrosophila lebanonensis]